MDRSIFSRQFIDIPESMLVDPPITIAPGEKKPLTANRGEISWHNTKERELGFQIVAKMMRHFTSLVVLLMYVKFGRQNKTLHPTADRG
ncbi:hypothetical protein [Rubritalea tangerina]|uniref:hypothetical protein n=1 Tax=Rubritalea tangerina TaxID=430798 RepID=UPI00361EA43B